MVTHSDSARCLHMASIKATIPQVRFRNPVRKLNQLVQQFLEWFYGTGDELDPPQ